MPLAVAILCCMVQRSIGLRLDAGLVERIDAARGDVPRARWIARAAERALEWEERGRGAEAAARAVVAQPERFGSAVVQTAREALSSAEAKRDVRPVPKGVR